jgi:uncharacterized membrane protein (TIGR02234 family)
VPTESVAAGTRSRGFGPVLLAGLAGGGLATLGASRVWFAYDGGSGAPLVVGVSDAGGQAPLAVSLGLVCLAAWGALLVTRGRVRTTLAVLAALAAAGLLAAWAWAWRTVPDDLTEAATAQGVTQTDSHPTAWYVLSGIGGLVALVAAVLAVPRATSWPAMGRRYDAPRGTAPRPTGASADAAADPSAESEQSSLDLWRALDEGHDPTSERE